MLSLSCHRYGLGLAAALVFVLVSAVQPAYAGDPSKNADPAFLFNIAQCHRKLGQNAQALDFYQQFLKKAPLDDPNRRQVEARIGDIQAEEQEKAARATAKPEPAPAPAPTIVAPAPTSEPPAPAPAVRETAAPTPSATPAGADLSLAEQAPPAPEAQPIYKKWWFWTAAGAVVVASAATTIYLMSSGGGTDVPTTSLGNRPVFP